MGNDRQNERSALAAERAKNVAFLILDVDGVCMDGKLFIDPEGRTFKAFHAQDGIGIKTALKAGIGIGVITGRDDPCTETRMRSLGVDEYHPGKERKTEALAAILKRQKIAPEQAAYLGDDWIDLAPMALVGLPMAVANARKEVRETALFVTENRGGEGAVRDAVDFILSAKGIDGTSFWLGRN